MPKDLIITDDVNLEAKDKSLLSHDSIYKKDNSKGTHINISDSKNNGLKMKSGIYAILSVSDKAINNRLYDYQSLKNNVMNEDWINPYKRPFLRNHDLYSDMPSGRIEKAWFVDHETLEVCCPNGQEKLPNKVLKHYQDLKCFDNGTGTTIVEIKSTEDTFERIKNGLDVTVSQSSYMGQAKCNICGEDYFGGNCEHITGRHYTIEKDGHTIDKICYLECKDFEPVELSIVNNPANNSSILYVLEDQSSKSKDDKDEDEIDNKVNDDKVKRTENDITDDKGKEPLTDEKENKTEDLMFKDLLKKTISKNVSDKFGEEMKEHFEALFDCLEKEEQIEKLQVFLDAIVITPVEDKQEEEPEVEEKEPEGNATDCEEKEPEVPEEKPEEKIEDDKKTPEDKANEKAQDLKDVYGDNKTKVVKDTQLNRKVAAMLQNL